MVQINQKQYNLQQNHQLGANIGFKGVNSTLGKRVFEHSNNLKTFLNCFSESKGIVGNLPFPWVQKIDRQQRSTIVKDFYADLNAATIKYRKGRNINLFQEQLNTAFKKAGIISEEQNLALGKVQSGYFGISMQIQNVFDDNFVIKIFKRQDEKIKHADKHGNHAEINRAQYWVQNIGKKNQYAQFYFGDVKAGYMFSEFIKEDAPFYTGRIIDESTIGLLNMDPNDNTIRGRKYDFGGLMLWDKHLNWNKTVRSIYKKVTITPLKEKIKVFLNFLRNEKYQNNKDAGQGLTLAYHLIPHEDRSDAVIQELSQKFPQNK